MHDAVCVEESYLIPLLDGHVDSTEVRRVLLTGCHLGICLCQLIPKLTARLVEVGIE